MNFDRRPYRMPMLLILLLSLAVAGPPAAAAEKADVILYNGKVFTSDTAHLWAQAVAVKGHRIQAVGGNAEVLALAGPGTRLLDLKGRVVIPGLNDAHVHVAGAAGACCSTSRFHSRSRADGRTRCSALIAPAAAATSPPGTWLLGHGGHQRSATTPGEPLALDQVAPESSGHARSSGPGTGCSSIPRGCGPCTSPETAAIRSAATTSAFPGTDGVNGVVHEYAEHRIRRRFAQRLSDAQIAAHLSGLRPAGAALGFTSVQDMSIGLPHERSVEILGPVEPRPALAVDLLPADARRGLPSSEHITRALVTASGIKWIADGTPIERLAFMTEPYADRPDPAAGSTSRAERLQAHLMERGLTGRPRKSQLLFHCVGDGADRHAARRDGGHRRPGRALAQPPHPHRARRPALPLRTSSRARDLGVVVVQNPTHLALARCSPSAYSPQVFGELEPLRSLLEAGIPLALGTDGIGGSIRARSSTSSWR